MLGLVACIGSPDPNGFPLYNALVQQVYMHTLASCHPVDVVGGASPYSQAEQTFIELLNTEDLDSKIWCALTPPFVDQQE